MNPKSKTSLPTVTDCNGCGACCLHMGFPAFVTGSQEQPAEKNWDLLPAGLRDELEAYIRNYEPPEAGQLDGPCFWFDHESRLCKHHEHRPNVCRDFEVGSDDCLGWRDEYREKIKTQ